MLNLRVLCAEGPLRVQERQPAASQLPQPALIRASSELGGLEQPLKDSSLLPLAILAGLSSAEHLGRTPCHVRGPAG